jgi:hypothetical protein
LAGSTAMTAVDMSSESIKAERNLANIQPPLLDFPDEFVGQSVEFIVSYPGVDESH